jgi:D-galactarolactone cycloisomerase
VSALSIVIADAEVLHVRKSIAHASGPAGAFNRWRESLFVKLTASDGAVGWGETYALAGTRSILDQQARQLVGTSVNRIGGWPPPLDVDEVGGSLALGAVDIAVHDLVGHVLGVPAHELLGPKRRSAVPVYASGFLYRDGREPAAHWLDEAQCLDQDGYRAMKVRLGGLPVADEMARLDAIRQSLPSTTTLMVDAWGAYSPSTAIRVGHELHRLGIAWFEEPCAPGPEYAGYEHLTSAIAVPVAGGESARTRASLKRLLDRRAVDVIQPDVAICGGLRNALFVAELAALHGTSCVPHTWNGGVMAAATMHLLAVLPPTGRVADDVGPWLEYDTTDNAFIRGALCDPPELVDGCFAIPEAPGLGVTVDESFLRAHLVDDT